MAVRQWACIVALAITLAPLGAASAENLDPYGGYLDLPAPGGATGFFRVEKVGDRWVFVTPAGHVFWYRGVQNIGDYFYVPGKYATKEEWGRQVRRRLKRWGFNAVGEYAAAAVSFGTTDRMPFIHLFRPANNAMRNTGGFAVEAVKEIIGNIPTSTYNGWRGILIDAFDPKYPGYAAAFFDSPYNYRWLPGGPSGEAKDNPWLIGYATEDGDEWFGVTGGAGPDPNVIKPHPGWSVLVSAHPMAASANPGGYGTRTYSDRTNYSKLALRDFLKRRYGGDLAALNAAWGARYTAWDHAGGYGVGSGLLDEAGQNPWVCRQRPCPSADWNTLAAMTPAARQDLDDFLEVFTERLASVAVQAIRAKDPNHLIFSPDSTNQWGYVNRPPILRAMARWFDVLHVAYQEGPSFTADRRAALGQTYDLTGKPMITWVGITANADSAMAAHPDPFGVDSAPTQAARGEKYRTYVTNLLNARGSNGDYPVIGIDFWGWMDQTNENANWGLVSLRDNAYDGQEAVIAAGTDPWGYPTGGETANYGDFLGYVATAHAGVASVLAASFSSAPTPTLSITNPANGARVNGTVTVSAVGSNTLSRVDLLMENRIMASAGASSIAYPWDTTTAANGRYRWVARGYDASGAVVTSSPVEVLVDNPAEDTTPPTVKITRPRDGTVLWRRGVHLVAVTASDNVGVVRVEVHVNGRLTCRLSSAPYLCFWRMSGEPASTVRIDARAYDAAGNVGSAAVTVTVE